MRRRRLSEVRIVNLGVNTALSFGSTVLAHPDEAGCTPACAPGVTYNPVGSGGARVVSNSDDGVVSGGGACSRQDTGFVGLEAIAGSVDGDSNGLSIDSGHHGGVVSTDGSVSRSVDFPIGGIVFAGTVCTSVRVSGFEFGRAGLEVSESFVSPTSVTTVAFCVAVNLLLSGESQELVSLDAVTSLGGLSGSERPARTALSLILDGGGAATSPILGSTELLSGDNVLFGVVVRLRLLAGTEHLLVFSLGAVGQVVVSSDVSRLKIGVVSEDVRVSLEPSGETDTEFLSGVVALAVVSNELHELKLLLSVGFNSGYGANGGDSDSGFHIKYLLL